MPNQNCAPAEVSSRSLAGFAPVTVKVDPGNATNEAFMFGVDHSSCAQAARLHSVRFAPLSSAEVQSNQEPSSLRTVVVRRDLKASAKSDEPVTAPSL